VTDTRRVAGRVCGTETCMKARRLIDGAEFGPETLKVNFAAFDAAWQEIAHHYDAEDAAQIEQARLQLAHAVLAAACDDARDGDRLKRDALQVMGLAYKPQA
jgi:hypothetical protein